jgi:hypothetical protein
VNYYDIPITDRVELYLQASRPDMWHSIGAIAISTHLVDWQVEQQVRALIADGKVEVEGGRLYRLEAAGRAGG